MSRGAGNDFTLTYQFTDRGGMLVYQVARRVKCDDCERYHWENTNQEVRLQIDGDKLVNMYIPDLIKAKET